MTACDQGNCFVIDFPEQELICRHLVKQLPDGRKGMVDRVAYMSFLENQLERVTATCKTVQVS